ncbi:MAG: TonB-dependent receptor, partial [Bacteroidota bacterium]|nr:TonB-dependent receptor [Bacteroidota bacterium]
MKIYIRIFSIIIILLSSYSLFAGTTGKISGKVYDSKTHESLPGINIIVVGTPYGAASDVEGNYFILNLPPGKYELKVTGIGYQTVSIKDVRVSVDQTTKIDFELSPVSIQLSEIVVQSSRPIVQKDLTSTEVKLSGDEISTLPVEDVSSLINLQAGVVDGHFRGGRSSEVKYLVDGVSVNDVYSGDFSMQAEVNNIQELQVISGTFNAEYGEALSGIVNQITKIAGDHYSGDLTFYTGDYISTHKSLFPNINHISPKDNYNIQGSISGPIPYTKSFVKFYISGKYLDDEGYLYGKRMFNPKDSSNFSANDKSQWYIGATGDNKYVPMNYSKRYTLQAKMQFAIGNAKGLTISGMLQNRDYRDYNQMYYLNPDGDYKKFQKGYLFTGAYNQTFGKSSFLDISTSWFQTDYKQYVYADPLDSRYVNPERQRDVSGNAFYTGGTENWHFYHKTKTVTAKVDFTSQLNISNEVKVGGEFDQHKLDYTDYQIHIDAGSGYVPKLPEPGSFDYNTYLNKPYQLAFYLQDKFELDYLIINAGVRFDLFQPDGSYLNDPNNIAVLDTLRPPFPSEYFTKAKIKYQFSPRLGISYPMSDKGAVHISYGHFFQIPPFEYLYRNPNFRVPLTGVYPDLIGNIIGNADLQPQRTTIYEVGLQQQLTEYIGATITAYYKDIRNLLGTEIYIKNEFKKFAKLVNRDYGAVSGLTITLDKRFSDGFSASLDYTYQVAKGNASDPNDAYNKSQANPPIAVNKVLVPLDWDRRHSLNFTLTAGIQNNFMASLIGRLGSGLP